MGANPDGPPCPRPSACSLPSRRPKSLALEHDVSPPLFGDSPAPLLLPPWHLSWTVCLTHDTACPWHTNRLLRNPVTELKHSKFHFARTSAVSHGLTGACTEMDRQGALIGAQRDLPKPRPRRRLLNTSFRSLPPLFSSPPSDVRLRSVLTMGRPSITIGSGVASRDRRSPLAPQCRGLRRGVGPFLRPFPGEMRVWPRLQPEGLAGKE